VFFGMIWVVMTVFSAWLLTRPSRGFGRWLLIPGGLGVAASLSFVAVYVTYRPPPLGAHIVQRPDVWPVPMLEWAALLALLLWFGCVSLEMIRQHPHGTNVPAAEIRNAPR
jgi:hypothetical protein